VDDWLAVIDDLLVRPYPAGAAVHEVDLVEREEFWDDAHFLPRYEELTADRNRIAAALTARYGPPRRHWLDREVPADPLLEHLARCCMYAEVWPAGDRRVVVDLWDGGPCHDGGFSQRFVLVVGDARRADAG
jgi:hypothetical protein